MAVGFNPFPPMANRPSPESGGADSARRSDQRCEPVGRLGARSVQPVHDGTGPSSAEAAGRIRAVVLTLIGSPSNAATPGRRLAERGVGGDGPMEAVERSRGLALRRAASAQAGGALFQEALRQEGLGPERARGRERALVDALVGGLRLEAMPPAIAEPILRDALRAALREAVRGTPAGAGCERRVAAAVAGGAVARATDSLRGGQEETAGSMLAAAAAAIGSTSHDPPSGVVLRAALAESKTAGESLSILLANPAVDRSLTAAGQRR